MDKEMFRWMLTTAALIILTVILLTILSFPGFINRVVILIIAGSVLFWWATHLEE